MKIYNEAKTELLTEYDETKGYLKDDTIDVECPEIEEVAEVSHYETIKEYPNGGKDVKKVIDVPGVAYQAAHTEQEEIKVYVPYSEAKLNNMAIDNRIAELKQKLNDTDYQAIKYAEGELSAEEYAEMKTQRAEWRKEINELETQYMDE
ncbi:MAG: hypothetical protein LUD19_06535 [Clostridia bacterium]|nr:hypothetical protein [Clostridia bacterium]